MTQRAFALDWRTPTSKLDGRAKMFRAPLACIEWPARVERRVCVKISAAGVI